MAHTTDHEMVSIYPFTEEEQNQMLTNASECVLMWATKDSWPVGVTHSFVWHDGKIWITFASHRHRAAAIKRNNKVSVNVSSAAYRPGAPEDLPRGQITVKGRGEFFDDEKTKHWFYTALSEKGNENNPEGAKAFYQLLDSPLRTVLCVTPEKYIMYNGKLAGRHMAGTVDESELGERLGVDRDRMNKEREKRGLPPR